MSTLIENLEHVPLVVPDDVVRASHSVPARVKKNLDDSMHLVLSAHVQAHPLWLVVVTYKKHASFRCRVWLRNDDRTLLPLLDEDGFYTVVGAEWAAYDAIAEITDGLRSMQEVRS